MAQLNPYARAMVCPNGCSPPMVMKAIPRPELKLNAVSRCMICLLLWECTPQNEVIYKSQPVEAVAISVPDGGYVLSMPHQETR